MKKYVGVILAAGAMSLVSMGAHADEATREVVTYSPSVCNWTALFQEEQVLNNLVNAQSEIDSSTAHTVNIGQISCSAPAKIAVGSTNGGLKFDGSTACGDPSDTCIHYSVAAYLDEQFVNEYETTGTEGLSTYQNISSSSTPSGEVTVNLTPNPFSGTVASGIFRDTIRVVVEPQT
jgi:hypothetical protein